MLAEEAKVEAVEAALRWGEIENACDEGVGGLPSSLAAVTELLDKARGSLCSLYALMVGSQI